jgi:hypothetical protein
VGIAGGVLVATGPPAALGPVLVIVSVLGGLPLLLITTLALVAVFSPHRTRRGTAERILGQLLSAFAGTRQR